MASDIEGFDELLKALDETSLCLGDRRKLIVRSLRKGAEPIRDAAEQSAPVETGRLRANIGISVTDQSATGADARIGPTNKGFYGLFSEVGTMFETAKPWLGPAYDQQEETAVAIVSAILGEGISEAYDG